ncbi:(S)-coclaurine N-methyltransferase [Scenedesmus sp. PABB004]|nr:(S)-coclaurine N-methyltransferase [Scenedesmus sp. PABB004]
MGLQHHASAVLARLLTWLYDLLGVGAALDAAMRGALRVVELNVVPDCVLRAGIRMLLRVRLASMAGSLEQQLERKIAFVQDLKCMPVAVQTAAANEQHYEVPTEYFQMVLGRHLKYSCCLYNSPADSLDTAERNMLALYCARARLSDGQAVLELGCGWGSLSLFMAAAYPGSAITSVSNSSTQREFITRRARELELTNLTVITADVVDFQAPGTYDRIVSIEMFEHMKNYAELLRRVASWLRPGGALFVHIFCHKACPYHFEVRDESDFMARYFFSGGTMPSLDLLLYFQAHLTLQQQWWVNGANYSATCEAWLANQDRQRKAIMPIFAKTYGREAALKWFVYWRLFYLACSELFAFNRGEEWGVRPARRCRRRRARRRAPVVAVPTRAFRRVSDAAARAAAGLRSVAPGSRLRGCGGGAPAAAGLPARLGAARAARLRTSLVARTAQQQPRAGAGRTKRAAAAAAATAAAALAPGAARAAGGAGAHLAALADLQLPDFSNGASDDGSSWPIFIFASLFLVAVAFGKNRGGEGADGEPGSFSPGDFQDSSWWWFWDRSDDGDDGDDSSSLTD